VLTTLDVAREIATFGLPGHDVIRLDRELSEGAFEHLVAVVRWQRLGGFFAAAVRADAFPVNDQQREEVERLHLEACASVLLLERRLLAAAQALELAGIELIVLKGTATAHLVYRDPSLRMFGDNDLLFRSDQFDAALEVLRDLGYQRPAAPPRQGFDRRFGKGATLKHPEGDELDTHRNLVFGTFGFKIDLERLFESATTFELAGRELRALGPETRLMHACYHSALGDPNPRFASVRDVAEMLTTGSHDRRQVLELARDWEARAVLSRAFELCRSHLGVSVHDPLVDALADYEPSRRERRAIASYVGHNRHYAAKVVATLPYLDSTRDRLAFLRASAAPSEPFVESRGGEPGLKWLARGLRSLLPGGIR
jgi:hypothetical protein